MCRSIFTHDISFVVCVSSFRVLASLRGHSSLASTPCDSTWNMHTFLEAAGCHLRVSWNAGDGRPECCRPILWIFDGLNEQEKYRTKHFVGSLDSRRVRNNGRQERMKYWKLYSKRKKVSSLCCCLGSMRKSCKERSRYLRGEWRTMDCHCMKECIISELYRVDLFAY